MRTKIEIDDKLMKDALKATGGKTKREAVSADTLIGGALLAAPCEARLR
jgi:hypothetical protein